MIPAVVLSILSSLLLAAHFMREGNTAMVLLSLSLPVLLTIRRKWAVSILSLFLFCGAALWASSAFWMTAVRLQNAMPWARMAAIMLCVTAFTLLSAMVLFDKRKTGYYSSPAQTETQSIAAFILTWAIVSAAHLKAGFSILILDRFLPGTAWMQILLLAVYAAWLSEKMTLSAGTAKLRSRIWLIFSIVFFAQFIMGIAGIEKFLMTGRLHIPVPALIIGGPVYRSGGFFMPVLFVSSLLLTGPAWCSHLCYFGAWDNLAAGIKRKPGQLKNWMKITRIAVLLLVPAAAFLMRLFHIPAIYAIAASAGFGIFGIGLMIFLSGKYGIMINCIAYCPVGLLADIIGKISPFRVRIGDNCTECGSCSAACRYGALSAEDIHRRKPGLTCSLCGDCFERCAGKSIGIRFLS
jgi:NAD-dependent dihydropyrimidine dehydrogenase PreA subunit